MTETIQSTMSPAIRQGWFKRSPPVRIWVALVILALFLLLAAVYVWGIGDTEASRTSSLRYGAPSSDHWLGTNAIGQDIATRAQAGTATALKTGVLVALLACVLGGVLGTVAGYWHGRWPDLIVSWMLSVIDAVPFYLLVGAFAYAAQGAPGTVIAALTLAFWTTTGRLVRAETLKLRETGYVVTARTQGVAQWQILLRHVVPNLGHLLLIQSTITFVAAVKSEVVLSFLGLGDSNAVSWGQMIAESSQDILAGYFMSFMVASGLLIVLVATLNVLADALQKHFNPRDQTPAKRH